MSGKEIKNVEGVGVVQLYPDDVVQGGWVVEQPSESVAYVGYQAAKTDFDFIRCKHSLNILFM